VESWGRVKEEGGSGVQEFRSSGVQEFRSSGLGSAPNFKNKEFRLVFPIEITGYERRFGTY
jgi:hypothetical protein